jgi:hypothetical protein
MPRTVKQADTMLEFNGNHLTPWQPRSPARNRTYYQRNFGIAQMPMSFCALVFFGLFVAIIGTLHAMREARRRRETWILQALYNATEATRERLPHSSDKYHDQVWLPLCNLIANHANRLGWPPKSASSKTA